MRTIGAPVGGEARLAQRPADELIGDQDHRAAKASRRSAPAEGVGEGHSGGRSGEREQAQQQRIGALDVAVAVLADRADERDGHDRQQRSRLGVVLVEAQEDHQAGNEQDATADAEQAGDDSAGDADGDGPGQRSTSSTAEAIRTAANMSAIERACRRCCNQVPISTPTTAGTPISRASSTLTFP